MSKTRRSDTFLLAAALFITSGAVLFYNIATSDGAGVTVSLSELVQTEDALSVSLMHEAAAQNLLSGDTVYTGTVPTEAPTGALLPPIVTPPTE